MKALAPRCAYEQLYAACRSGAPSWNVSTSRREGSAGNESPAALPTPKE